MRMYDIIEKKRNGNTLDKEEIKQMIESYTKGDIPDYQMSAMLMSIYFQGMTDTEMGDLTQAMAQSGAMVDLSEISGVKVDKHSTGGVGDKTTLIVAPIAAACGIKVAKMSGRGLGHTGGTVDKLEAIPGIKTALSHEQFFEIVKTIGISVIGQSGNLAPADKKLYALRDVTATVESIPLIASSIMSKKLAAGSDCIVLDVKTGSGAFMKTQEEAIKLAEKMVAIGEHAGKKTIALVTDMDIPLGENIGNSLEIIEAIATLKGQGPQDLTEVSLALAANMIYLGGLGSMAECRAKAEQAIASGEALRKLAEMVKAQGGDTRVIEDTSRFSKAEYAEELCASTAGYIIKMDVQECGTVSCMLGAGRETKESEIDYAAGLTFKKKTGDKVSKGEVIAYLYSNKKEILKTAKERLAKALTISEVKPEIEPLILARIDKNGITNNQE
jgi:pyrimidine-nucleoside phosphorylase